MLNTEISKDPNDWLEKHDEYEKIIIDFYGINRRGTDMKNRFTRLKNNPKL